MGALASRSIYHHCGLSCAKSKAEILLPANKQGVWKQVTRGTLKYSSNVRRNHHGSFQPAKTRGEHPIIN